MAYGIEETRPRPGRAGPGPGVAANGGGADPGRFGAAGPDADGGQPTDLPEALLAYLNELPNPRLLLAPAGPTLCWTNPAGAALLDEGRSLVRRGDRVLPADPALTPDFVRWIQQPPDQSVWTLGGERPERATVLRAARLRGDRTGRVMLCVYEPKHRRLFARIDLRARFGLTPAELKVVDLLAQGHPVERVSALVGISVETARTHIRRVYSKMDVSCREELLFTVNDLRAP